MSFIALVSNIPQVGDDIAQQVAERLGHTLIGDALLESAAKEHSTTLKKLRRALAGDRATFNSVTHAYEKSIIYLKSTLASYLTEDSCVLVGPPAYLIPPSIGHVLRVGVVADRAYRVEQLAKADGVTEREAESRVSRVDEALAKWVREHRQKSPWDPSLFDMKIRLPDRTPAEAVELICDAASRDVLRPTNKTIRATLDFLLAAQVNLALLEAGHHNTRVEATDGKVVVTLVTKRVPSGALGRTVHALKQESQLDGVVPVCKQVEGVREVEVRLSTEATIPRTLLVDDEEEYVSTLSERLGMRDIASEVVFDGHQALASLKTDQPEVMILDLKMPGIDGLEVLRSVKHDHPDIQVIVVTGHGSEEDERRARELGAFDYLHKPVDINTLSTKISEAAAAARKPHEAEDEPGDPSDT